MRILFKTSYLDDIRLFRHGGYRRSGTACWSAACWLRRLVLREFYVGEISQVFILAIAGVGLMLLIGYTGLASLGHGAFMAIGAYVNTYLITKGVPFLVSFPVAGLAALAAGVAVALPANRMTGIYLAIATLAFSQIVEQVVVRWKSVTRGFQGMPVPPPDLFGHRLTQCLGVLLPVPGGARGGGARRHQPDALADGPGHGGDPRLGDLRPEPRRQPGALQDHRLRHQRLHHGARRRAVRPQAQVHLARRLQHHPVDPAAADGGGGRAWARSTAPSSGRSSSAACRRRSR